MTATAASAPLLDPSLRGSPSHFLTSMGDEKLQKLDPDEAGRGELPVYSDIAGEVGATAHIPYAGGDKRPSTAWHAEFALRRWEGRWRPLRQRLEQLSQRALTAYFPLILL